MYMKKELIADFAPSQVFLHLGTNNLNDAGDTGKTCAAKVINLLEEIHLSVPEAEIYYFGIERTTNPAFALSHEKSLESNAAVKEHCERDAREHRQHHVRASEEVRDGDRQQKRVCRAEGCCRRRALREVLHVNRAVVAEEFERHARDDHRCHGADDGCIGRHAEAHEELHADDGAENGENDEQAEGCRFKDLRVLVHLLVCHRSS